MHLPPLRDRKSDIPALAQAFCERYSIAYRRKPLRLSIDALKRLHEYDWPGNVRQLRNCIERAVVLEEGDEITLDVLPDEIVSNTEQKKPLARDGDEISVPFTVDFRGARKEFERKYIERCLEQASGNVTKAASLLGMHRQSLQHKIKELGLTKRFIADE